VLPLLEAIARSDHSAAVDAMWSLSAIGLRIVTFVSGRLQEATPERKRGYLDLVASLFADPAEGNEARVVARQLLSDAKAEVRVAAVNALQAVEGEIDAVAALGSDRVASVRAAVAKAFSGRTHPTAIGTLVHLLRDRADTSDSARYGDGEDYVEYGVAEAAAEALAAVESWTKELAAAVDEFLGSNEPTAQDSVVRSALTAAKRSSFT
jgi:hypothetical protein